MTDLFDSYPYAARFGVNRTLPESGSPRDELLAGQAQNNTVDRGQSLALPAGGWASAQLRDVADPRPSQTYTKPHHHPRVSVRSVHEPPQIHLLGARGHRCLR
jgi:hypothetical protein